MANDNDIQKGFPISALIAAPLAAAADASLSLAEASAKYINTVGFVKDEDGRSKARQVDFKFERPRQDELGNVFIEEVHIQVPLLAIAPAPNLQIDSVDVEFSLEIRSASTERETDDVELVEDDVQLRAVSAAHMNNTRTTDKSSKYHFEVRATNHGIPETLARILDMMAAGVAPRSKPEPADKKKLKR